MEDYTGLATPDQCVADFCIVPIGTPSASVSYEVAAVQRLLKASGLQYSMHSAGTTVEGSWDDVMEVIGQAHTLLHDKGIARCHTDIRVGSRTDKLQNFSDKVAKVESLLAGDSNEGITTPNSGSSFRSTAIQAPATTTQTTSYGSKGPWMSASMHLKRSFVPLHDTEITDKSVSTWKIPGHHTTSVEFRTGFEGLQAWHVVYILGGVFTIGSFFKLLFSPSLYNASPVAVKRGGRWI